MEHWGHATSSMCVHNHCHGRRRDVAVMSAAVPFIVVLLTHTLQSAHFA